jgi:uncharacterized membrane protein
MDRNRTTLIVAVAFFAACVAFVFIPPGNTPLALVAAVLALAFMVMSQERRESRRHPGGDPPPSA